MSLYAHYAALLDGVLDQLEAEGALPPGLARKAVAVEPPRDVSHGDLATNAAMVLAKGAGTNPRALAALIALKLEALPDVTEVSVAGPGFINLKLTDAAWRRELETIIVQAGDYGKSAVGKSERVNVEYVSANPTGP
ncbi:MAG: arginine--tRNA ligase, partial [Sphingomonas bacterium]|nr:arginine--tRNA ligase [Sphingomonas bacterium]